MPHRGARRLDPRVQALSASGVKLEFGTDDYRHHHLLFPCEPRIAQVTKARVNHFRDLREKKTGGRPQ